MIFNKIVLNIPHSSVNGVFDKESGWRYNAHFINAVMRETDWHTDFIFNIDRPDVVACIFGYSRFLVDVERLDNDPLEKEGRGILYANVNGHQRDSITDEERNRLLSLRSSHLARLSEELTEDSILVDCHSFNEDMARDVDICIGFNDDWSRPDEETIAGIVDIFEKSGYKVALNWPYSNSITPKANFRYKSIMIEVNKKTYLKQGHQINADSLYAPRLSHTIKKVYSFLLSDI